MRSPIALVQKPLIPFTQLFNTAVEQFPTKFEQLTSSRLNLLDPGHRVITQTEGPAPLLADMILGHMERDRAGPLAEVQNWLRTGILLPEDDADFLNDVIRVTAISNDDKTGGIDLVVVRRQPTKKLRLPCRIINV